jgi:large subunit ribosomal protein L4
MSKAQVYNQEGSKTTTLDLNSKIFGIEEVSTHLVHQAVRTQLSNARKGTAHTKNRGEVAGSGKKPWQQKGTGRARAGSVRSPLWRGGGITFGPRSNRNWTLKMNKPAYRKAIFSILTDKLANNKLIVLDSFDTASKTKDIVKKISVIAKAAEFGKKTVLVIDKPNAELNRAFRNSTHYKLVLASMLNPVDLLNYDLILTKDSLPVIEKVYLPAGRQV